MESLKEISKIAKKINSKTKTKEYGSNTLNDERKELERGYAIARAALFEYSFQ